jgi:hypothetical protein
MAVLLLAAALVAAHRLGEGISAIAPTLAPHRLREEAA